MNLLDILARDCIRVPLKATDKKAAIDELVDLLAESGKVSDAESLKKAVLARESTRTTGIGRSLAIPHGKSESVSNLALAIGLPAEPLDFSSIDNRPVKLIALLASPLDRTADHIQALAQISRIMGDDTFRERMFAATDEDAVYNVLQEYEAQDASRSA